MRSLFAKVAVLSILLAFPYGIISAGEPACGYALKATVVVTPPGRQPLSFRAGIADTTELHRKGLSECPLLPKGQGLFFIFADLVERSFWMYRTTIPLAIVFIGEDMKVLSVKKGEPGSTLSLPSGRPVRYVLEVNWDEGKDIAPGWQAKMRFD